MRTDNTALSAGQKPVASAPVVESDRASWFADASAVARRGLSYGEYQAMLRAEARRRLQAEER